MKTKHTLYVLGYMILFAFSCVPVINGQALAIPNYLKTDTLKPKEYVPEIFTNGFIDIMNNGQVNAAARFIRLSIGEPEKFFIPLSIFGGVSANNFQNNSNQISARNNDQLVNNFINPLSGLINLSVDGVLFRKRSKYQLSKMGLLYHFGERVLTGFKADPLSFTGKGKSVNFLNSFASAGIYFQTGAWERNNKKNVGIFWFALRYISSYTNPTQIKDFLPEVQTNGIYLGYSPAFGIEINKLINLKMIYYKYTKNPEIENSFPIYQFSFNYSLK